MSTFASLKTQAYRRLGYASDSTSPDPAVVSRIADFINETHRQILTDKHFAKFRRQLLTCASIAGVPYMAMPRAAVRIFGIQDRTNNLFLTEKNLIWIRSIDPGLKSSAANPWVYARYNTRSAVFRQPSAAAQIFFKSTNAGDTTQSVKYEGVRTNGFYFTDTVALNGLTAVGGTPTDVVAITKMYITATIAGDVSAFEASGVGNQLSTIPAGATNLYAAYDYFHLYPVPSGVIAYTVDAYVHIEDMSQDNDVALIPEDFDRLILCGVKIREYELREKMDKQLLAMRDEWKSIRNDMIVWSNGRTGLENQQGYQGRYSQLGSFFPPGT